MIQFLLQTKHNLRKAFQDINILQTATVDAWYMSTYFANSTFLGPLSLITPTLNLLLIRRQVSIFFGKCCQQNFPYVELTEKVTAAGKCISLFFGTLDRPRRQVRARLHPLTTHINDARSAHHDEM